EGDQGGIAQICDPRNDENVIVAQLHVAFLQAHNNAVKKFDLDFDEAQKLIRQHYQWIVLKDYLPRIADPRIVDEATRENTFFPSERLRKGAPGSGQLLMPFEFSAAAYRFGHSMVRGAYNRFSSAQPGVSTATLKQLFDFTGRGGFVGF